MSDWNHRKQNHGGGGPLYFKSGTSPLGHCYHPSLSHLYFLPESPQSSHWVFLLLLLSPTIVIPNFDPVILLCLIFYGVPIIFRPRSNSYMAYQKFQQNLAMAQLSRFMACPPHQVHGMLVTQHSIPALCACWTCSYTGAWQSPHFACLAPICPLGLLALPIPTKSLSRPDFFKISLSPTRYYIMYLFFYHVFFTRMKALWEQVLFIILLHSQHLQQYRAQSRYSINLLNKCVWHQSW